MRLFKKGTYLKRGIYYKGAYKNDVAYYKGVLLKGDLIERRNLLEKGAYKKMMA